MLELPVIVTVMPAHVLLYMFLTIYLKDIIKAQQLCFPGTCKILLWYDNQELIYS